MRSAGQIAFLEAEVEEHLRGDGDVFRLAAVGRAGERELVIAPAKLLETARVDERHHLERLGARAPWHDVVRVPRAGDQPALGVDDGGVHLVPRLHVTAAGDENVEAQGFHVAER